MYGSRHAKRVQIEPRFDTKYPRQDCPVEQSVVTKQGRVCPVKLIQPRLDLLVGAAEPDRLVIILLYRYADHLELLVADVLLSRQLGQTKVFGVVRLEIYCDDAHIEGTNLLHFQPFGFSINPAAFSASMERQAPSPYLCLRKDSGSRNVRLQVLHLLILATTAMLTPYLFQFSP